MGSGACSLGKDIATATETEVKEIVWNLSDSRRELLLAALATQAAPKMSDGDRSPNTSQGISVDTSKFDVDGYEFEVPARYTDLEVIGNGDYAVVCSAQDEELEEQVAIKKVEGVAERFIYMKGALRELRMLRRLRHENLIDIKSIFLPGPKDYFEDVYIITDLLETDLACLLKSPQPLENQHVEYMLYQILRGIKYVHSAEVIHRDLDPSNILLNANCDVKICDFGSARVRFTDEKHYTSPVTEYVCKRVYRAPEVLCSWKEYSSAIDIWSIGCILGEMLLRKPLFPGANTQQQLERIVKYMGCPSQDDLLTIPNDKCRKFIQSLPPNDGPDLKEVLEKNGATEESLCLLTDMLQFNPNKRLDATAGLEHPYLADFSCPEDEPVRDPLDISDFEFERRRIGPEALREEIYLEAMNYYPEKVESYRKKNRYDVTRYRLLAPSEPQFNSDEEPMSP